ncbi:MAG: response regulator [Labilithrix sp.]|nr:response regulator [Labilithrix sp.]MCW5811076.1 response regulator [Labilithrix sp.]
MHSAPTSARSNSKNGGARLGGARADFVAGLGRKVADLRGVHQRVREDADGARSELRRKLSNLASSAKMMKFDAMERAIGETLGMIDRAPADAQLEAVDLDAIEQLIEDLPALAWGDGMARSSRAEEAEQQRAAPKREVLVVGNAQIAEALLSGGSGKMVFTCETTPDAATAYDLVRTTEPDLVVLDADVANALDLVDALMDDPLTETVPIIVIGSFQEHGEASRYVAMGVAKTVAKPMTKHALREVCEETLSPERGSLTAQAVLGEPTLEELGERLAQEVREAIVGRADPSARGRRVALGQGTEVLGAVWGAIARVREVVTARSDGAIRFAGGPEGALTPALLLHAPELARSDRAQQKRERANDVRLEGRRVVVADDDPAVVWFLADLLKTAGCEVLEAFDGRHALTLAYEHSPDLVISDILMPNLDGFSLCRALRRDVALRDTPVILLSWKEDLLQRVRELGANAAGYVRKESDTRAIIARVREALRARGRIEARLQEEGEVRGRLDGVSIKTLLETVSAIRPDARISVRDASFLYEVEMRGGAPRRVTRTDADGGFVKGGKMLAQMLGVGAGRFAVTTSTSPIEAELEGNLSSQLAKPTAKARAAIGLLTGARVNTVVRVRFDEAALVDYLKATPEKARLVARRLANGAAPRELVIHGGCEAALLDDILCDLAARGLVVAIEGDGGEDMLTPAVTALLQHVDARADLPVRGVTPPPPADPFACADVASEPVCVSPPPPPAPAPTPRSLEDAVLREVSHRSPSPEPLPNVQIFPFNSPSPMIVDPTGLRLRAPTPSPTFIEQMAEPTIIDAPVQAHAEDEEDDIYRSDAIVPGPEDEAIPQISQQEMTPFEAVTDDGAPAPAPPKKRAWPMLAFITATGVIAWSVLHFSTSLPKQQESQPPAVEMKLPPAAETALERAAEQDRADEVFYTVLAAETQVAEGEGVIDVTAPPDAVVLVDGKERAKGSAAIPASAGKHAVTVKKDKEEHDCTIDVRMSRAAHVRF